ncbi:MAG: dicarboxylate/amino acid:cation symporter [Alphaproteobacteria bacterium]|nr:dicarboxylate/amino acid:cation symporter [Alphaproteobacteria bacterium]
MHNHFSKKYNISILISLLFGVLLGYYNNDNIYHVSGFFIKAFVNLLQFISLPIIFLSLTSAITKLETKDSLKIILGKTLKYTILTTLIAAFIAMLVYKFLLSNKISMIDAEESNHTLQVSNIASYLINIIPANIVKIFSDNNIMAVVFAALLIGITALFLEKKYKEQIHNTFSTFFELFMKIATFVLRLMPFVMWAFAVEFVKDIQSGFKVDSLVYYIAAIMLANFLQTVVILPLFLKMKGISAVKTFKGMIPALVTAFFSKSSSATMPTTIHCINKNLNINSKTSSIIVPLCTTINMNACAGFIYITVLFVSQSNGIIFTEMDYISWIFLAVIAAIGNAGVPMGCFFMASAYLASMGVSTYMMGIILPFYTILDMFETAINVWSDSCVTSVVDKELKEESL